MNEFQTALLIAAAVVGLFTWQLDRAWLWILAGAASFAASTAWARYGLPHPVAFTALCDVGVCLLIFAFAKHHWELFLFRLFQLSVLVSIVFLGIRYMGAPAGAHYAYVATLELINWIALALILGVGFMQGIADRGTAPDPDASGVLFRARQALFAPRSPSSSP